MRVRAQLVGAASPAAASAAAPGVAPTPSGVRPAAAASPDRPASITYTPFSAANGNGQAFVPGLLQERPRAENGRTRVMMMTRGTRGDIQDIYIYIYIYMY